MRIKKLTLILSTAIALVACNGGGTDNQEAASETQSNKSEKMVPNPRILHNHIQQDNLKSLAGTDDFNKRLDDLLKINNGVQIGFGYDPSTGAVVAPKQFNLDNFYYMLGNDQLPGLDMQNKSEFTCSSGAYGEEIGSASHYSSADMYKANLSGGIGIGLAKVSAALSAEYEKSYANTGMHFDKVFGARIICDVNSIAAPTPTGNPTEQVYKAAGDAVRMASQDINTAIQQIQDTTDKYERQSLIKDFYKNYGTYMISGVKLGAVAMKNIHMEESKEDGSDHKKIAAAASYSSPFSKVEGSAEMQQASKFSAAGWKYSIGEAQYPKGTYGNELKETIKSIEEQLNTMKQGGIIDFEKFKHPDTAKVDKEFKAPVAPDLNNNKVSEDVTKASTTYSELSSKLSQINTTKPSATLKKSRYEKNAQLIGEVSSHLSKLNEPSSSNTRSLYLFLSSAARANLIENMTPKIKTWEDNSLAELYSAAVENISNPTELAEIEAEINEVVKNANTAAADQKQDKDKDDQDAKNKRDNQGITWSQFLLKKMKETSPQEYTKYIDNKDNSSLADDIFAKWQQDHNDAIKKWKKEFDEQGQVKVPLMVTAAEAQKFQAEAQKFQTKSLQSTSIYSGYGVIDFSITPWAKIFPVLSQDISIDDSKEVGKGLILNNINTNYEQEFQYLNYAQKVDGSLQGLYEQAVSEHVILEKLKLALMNAANSTDENPTVFFNGTDYDIGTGQYIDLNQAVTDYINKSNLVKSNWYKITKKLFDKGFLGMYGSFAGLQPVQPASEASNEYSVISQNGTIDADGNVTNLSPIGTEQDFLHKFESLSVMNAAPIDSYYNKSPMRLWLSTIVNLLKFRTNLNPELPKKGLLEGNRGVLLPSNPQMKNNYMTSIYNPANRIALKYVPANNKPSQLLGIVPVVLSTTTISGDIVRGLGVVDSKGRIWGLGSGDGGDGGDNFTNGTRTYTLDLSKVIGSNPNSPAYALTLEDIGPGASPDGLVWETTSNPVLDGSKDLSHYYSRYILGASFNTDIIPAYDAYDKQDSIYSNTENRRIDLRGINYNDKTLNNNNPLIKYGLTAEIFRSDYTVDNSKVLTANPRVVDDITRPSVGAYYRTSFILTNTKFSSLPRGSVLKHQLVITPITDNNVKDMNNLLKETPAKQPLLPTYPF